MKTELYWSEQGMVGCEDHIPHKGTDTWIWDRWERVPATKDCRELKCETCGKGMSND